MEVTSSRRTVILRLARNRFGDFRCEGYAIDRQRVSRGDRALPR